MKRQGLVVYAGDPPGDSVSVPMDLMPVGVVFFPSLPSMGVMLFPSFVLGTASGEGGTLFVPLFLFSPLLPLSLLSSPSLSFSHSLFLSFPLSFSLWRPPFFFFLKELLVLFISEMQGMTLLFVINCTFIGIKRDFLFWVMNLRIQMYVIFLHIPRLSCLRRLTK